LICGWRQGAFVLVSSALTGWYYFMEPLNSFAIRDKTTIGALGGFLIVGGFIILLVAALREAIRRVELANAAKDILFGELQHRVANNLQLVVALLRNAQRNLRNPVLAAETLTDAEERIMAMSQLHRRLNDGTAFTYGLNTLLREMLSNAFRDLPVTFQVDVGDIPDLSIDQMTAIALLVNEAALNAAKHVFSKGLGRRFDVSLSKDESGHLHLVIKDDGPGMSTEVIDAQARSLGMGIMESFAKQLGGPLEIGEGGGTSLSVEFTIP
jgi:two-component system, sensor histidine kinase PdtaS